LFFLWLVGGGGAGDVKMMAALGAWLGWKLTVAVFLGSAVVTVVLSTARMAYRLVGRVVSISGESRASGSGSGGKAFSFLGTEGQGKQRFPVPYAVPVALSTWVVLALIWMDVWKWAP
jgi:prepilin peptidase CpaA